MTMYLTDKTPPEEVRTQLFASYVNPISLGLPQGLQASGTGRASRAIYITVGPSHRYKIVNVY